MLFSIKELQNDFMFQKFITFAIIGLLNAILDTTVWKILSNIFSKSEFLTNLLKKVGLNIYSGAQLFSFIVALGSSFYFNSTFTWKTNPLESQNRFLLYITVSVTAWVVTVYYLNFFTKDRFLNKFNSIVSRFEDHMHLYPKLKKLVDYPLLVKISSILLSMVINFFGYNYLVFR